MADRLHYRSECQRQNQGYPPILPKMKTMDGLPYRLLLRLSKTRQRTKCRVSYPNQTLCPHCPCRRKHPFRSPQTYFYHAHIQIFMHSPLDPSHFRPHFIPCSTSPTCPHSLGLLIHLPNSLDYPHSVHILPKPGY